MKISIVFLPSVQNLHLERRETIYFVDGGKLYLGKIYYIIYLVSWSPFFCIYVSIIEEVKKCNMQLTNIVKNIWISTNLLLQLVLAEHCYR